MSLWLWLLVVAVVVVILFVVGVLLLFGSRAVVTVVIGKAFLA